jgi:hypothetical protein
MSQQNEARSRGAASLLLRMRLRFAYTRAWEHRPLQPKSGVELSETPDHRVDVVCESGGHD